MTQKNKQIPNALRKKYENEKTLDVISTSNKVENQNKTYNSKKEGLGPNGKR